MQNEFHIEKKVRKEADEILYSKRLIELLNQYGRAEITGSYPLKLMCKKDLDISLVNSNFKPESFFELGSKIVALLKPHSVYYRDTRVRPVKNRPTNALYFGILFNDWKIDLWVIDEEWWGESKKYTDKIIESLTEEKRLLILEIKEHYKNLPEYGKLFSSKEVYRAVLEENINSLGQFQKNF